MCTAKRFHVGNEEQTCRIGCIGEPDCPLTTTGTLSFSTSLSQSGGTPGSNFKEINYSTTSSLKNFEDCMEGRIRLLTAITPTYAHAHQSLCLAGRTLDFPHQRFRLPSAKTKYPNLPNIRTTTRGKRKRLPRMGHLHRWRHSQLGGTPSSARPMEHFVENVVRGFPPICRLSRQSDS